MIANLFRPWILARLSAGAAAAALVLVGMAVGWRVLRHFRVSRTSEGQLALERRAELVAALVEIALGASIAALLLAVLGADRMTGSIRGAMCAYGVFDASAWGFRSLGLSIAAALACAAWIALHRLDLRLRGPTLTRAKFLALFVVGPLVLADFAASTAFALDLDLRVVASCCSSGIDAARAVERADGTGASRDLAAISFVAAATVALALSILLWRRPSARRAALVAGASLLAGASAMPAVILWVAPHAYESPTHPCPFCLLRADAYGIGWPLFAGLFAGTALGLAAGTTGALERASGEPDAARALGSRIGGAGAAAWALTLGSALWPVARWWVVGGGRSLFGDG